MTLYETLSSIVNRLHFLGDFARVQAEEILMHFTGYSRTELMLRSGEEIGKVTIDTINDVVKRRISGEPLQYILGTAYFYSREFKVNPDVLIPRPDTEILIEQVLNLEPKTPARFADIGTGSGIIACILTEERPSWSAISVDISVKALRTAIVNSRTGIRFVCANLLDAIKKEHQFDFLVSNPPYIPLDEYASLDISVKDHEPTHALTDNADGLGFYRYFALHAHNWIRKDGCFYCEIGYNQGDVVKTLFCQHRWRNVRLVRDLGGNDRVICAIVPADIDT
jgi:release factor glutamine methyltransferase